MSASIDLYDVNVWIALLLDTHPHHSQAKTVLGFSETPAFCRVTHLRTLRLLTNTKIMGKKVMKPSEAVGYLKEIEDHLGTLWIHEPSNFNEVWTKNIHSWNFDPNEWTDAYLATLADVSESRLVTFDQGFKKFPLGDRLLILDTEK